MAALIKLDEASPSAPAERNRIKNAASIEIGKPNENKFSCGAERVITPIDALTIISTTTTGIMISVAAKNIAPMAAVSSVLWGRLCLQLQFCGHLAQYVLTGKQGKQLDNAIMRALRG